MLSINLFYFVRLKLVLVFGASNLDSLIGEFAD